MRNLRSGFLLITLLVQAARAQSTGSVQGIVRDEQRVLIPGVQITLTNSETKESYKARSNEAGEYKLQVPAGIYSITAELPGFMADKVSDVRITQNEPTQLNPITLKVGHNPNVPFERGVIPIPLAPIPSQASDRL